MQVKAGPARANSLAQATPSAFGSGRKGLESALVVGGTRGALGRRMDQLFFTLKRAHHATLKYSRKVLAPFGMTAARFDFMQAIAMGECTQLRLRKRLGLAKASISEMLCELERVGLIWRMRAGRTKMVFLARKGREVFRRVALACMRSGRVARDVDAALERCTSGKRGTLASICWYLRDAFGDAACTVLYSGWYPSMSDGADALRGH
jgi:DNA-binding MarR family transcriptional regulator